MTTPDYQTLMLPVLEALGDGEEWPVRELIARVADRAHISEADRMALLPSGRGALYVSRIHWATTYLVKAGLAVRPRRAVVQLTDEGQRGHRPIIGKHDWKQYTAVADVPLQTTSIECGLTMNGRGKIWIDEDSIQVDLDDETPNPSEGPGN